MKGLRERKKAVTEQAIVDAAMELFAARGFAATTADDIAAAASVGRRTLFRYFSTKEDIVLDSRRIDRAFALAALHERRESEDEVECVMRVLSELQRRTFAVFRPEHQRALHRLTHDEPSLVARTFVLMQEVRDLIVKGLLPEHASRSEKLRARLLAMSCIIAVDASVTTWIEGGMQEDLERVLIESSDYLRMGFAARPTGRPPGHP